jgi:predicted transposase/invertase (TIGR01784 family)
MFDNTCKFLAETFPTDFASWILGEPIPLTELKPSELSTEPIRADSLIFLASTEIILHLEFQTTTDESMALRMLDYWVRLRRKFPTKRIHQTVIYLRPTNSPLVRQTSYSSETTNHQFQIIRLWEQSPQTLQQYQGLLPFVALSRTDDPEEELRQVTRQIEAIPNREIQANLVAATYVISGLALEREVLQRLLRREIMKESVTYQEILEEGRVEGEARGKAEGRAEAVNQIALNMLRSNISPDLIAQFTGLSLEQIQELSLGSLGKLG